MVLLPDTGRGDLSKVFDERWMATMGFARSDGLVVADLLEAAAGDLPDLIYLEACDSVREAVLTMRKFGVSQLPVAKGEMPVAAAEVVGAVSELWLMNQAYEQEDLLDMQIEDVMQSPLTTIGIGEPVDRAVGMLESAPALLVIDGGRPRTVISRTDVLEYLSPEEL